MALSAGSAKSKEKNAYIAVVNDGAGAVKAVSCDAIILVSDAQIPQGLRHLVVHLRHPALPPDCSSPGSLNLLEQRVWEVLLPSQSSCGRPYSKAQVCLLSSRSKDSAKDVKFKSSTHNPSL